VTWIKKSYETIRDNYVLNFLNKNDWELNMSDIKDECYYIGGVVSYGDYYFDFDDIRYDVDNDIPKGEYFKYYDYVLEHSMNGYPNINYKTYLMGYRHKKRTPYKEFMYRFKNRIKSIKRFIKSKLIINRDKKMKESINKFKELLKEYEVN